MRDALGAGGQALGVEQAGFDHASLLEIEVPACQTLRINRPNWNVVEGDLHHYSADPWKGIALLAGGVPCPPFSKAGKQLGHDYERDLFPEAIRLVNECVPEAVMLACSSQWDSPGETIGRFGRVKLRL